MLTNAIFPGIFMPLIPTGGLVKDDIEQCIKQDERNGRGEEVAMVQVRPYFGALLYVEGTITDEHLKDVEEGDGYIDIPGVLFGSKTLTVRVVNSDNGGHKYFTADKNGAMIP